MTTQSIIERMTVPELSRVYVLGSLSAPVTFSSQQFRSFNLVWTLFERKIISPGDSVVVIGGGLAGVTAAAAADLKGCKVKLIERTDGLFSQQRGNFTRQVHPNILRWPHDHWDVQYTRFPHLNWRAGKAHDIVEEIESQLNANRRNIEIKLGYDVNLIENEKSRVWIRANRLSGIGTPTLDMGEQYSAAILAVGFGYERSLPGVPFRSYWENDGLHQQVIALPTPRSYLVSGVPLGQVPRFSFVAVWRPELSAGRNSSQNFSNRRLRCLL